MSTAPRPALCARFQCVNWISWKQALGFGLTTNPYTRFQCVNWISWKPVWLSRTMESIRPLASNALIGLVGNAPGYGRLTRTVRGSRFQCVNWISWKLGCHNLRFVHTSLASNALIGLVGNQTLVRLWIALLFSLASNALIGLVGNLPRELMLARSITRFQCVNWISWKLRVVNKALVPFWSRFQCVNWISWKLDHRVNLHSLYLHSLPMR